MSGIKKQLVKSAYLALKDCLSAWLRIKEEAEVRDAYNFLSEIVVLIERDELDLEELVRQLLVIRKGYAEQLRTLKKNVEQKQIQHKRVEQLVTSYETLLQRIDVVLRMSQ
jgi:hypothetical protein